MSNAVQEGVYAQYFKNVITMAQEKGGVSRPDLMRALAISRTVADGLIARCKLRHGRTEGKKEYFYVSRGSKKILEHAPEGTDTDTKEIDTMTESPNPADAKGAVSDTPGDEQASKPGKKGKNRLPQDEQDPPTSAPVPPANAAPVGTDKGAPELEEEIRAIQGAIAAATAKSEQAYKTYTFQKAHADALGQRLATVLAQRLAKG